MTEARQKDRMTISAKRDQPIHRLGSTLAGYKMKAPSLAGQNGGLIETVTDALNKIDNRHNAWEQTQREAREELSALRIAVQQLTMRLQQTQDSTAASKGHRTVQRTVQGAQDVLGPLQV